jgi:hypothetical protein
LYAYPLRRLSTVPGYLHADTVVAVTLFLLVFLESTSKRSLLIPTDPVGIIVILSFAS